MIAVTHLVTGPVATAAPQLVVLVDADDLEDGDLAARIAEIHMPAAAAPRRADLASAAARQARADAVVAARTVVQDRHAAVLAHRLGVRAAALVG